MMVIAAGRDERRLAAIALDQLKAEHAAIKAERALDIGDFEMDMADANTRVDWLGENRGAKRLLGEVETGGHDGLLRMRQVRKIAYAAADVDFAPLS